jgi:hypothetical protein
VNYILSHLFAFEWMVSQNYVIQQCAWTVLPQEFPDSLHASGELRGLK